MVVMRQPPPPCRLRPTGLLARRTHHSMVVRAHRHLTQRRGVVVAVAMITLTVEAVVAATVEAEAIARTMVRAEAVAVAMVAAAVATIVVMAGTAPRAHESVSGGTALQRVDLSGSSMDGTYKHCLSYSMPALNI